MVLLKNAAKFLLQPKNNIVSHSSKIRQLFDSAPGLKNSSSLFEPVTQLYDTPPPEIILSHKAYLAGSEHPTFPNILKYATHDDLEPLTLDNHKVSIRSKFSDVQIEYIAEEINQVLRDRLVSSGAVLFRNLGYYIPDSIAFSKLISNLGERMPYIAGMATRDEMEKSPGVMNASDDPEECTLEPHLEMCYREEMPSKILFYCLNPPTQGGQTPICDMRKVTTDLNAKQDIVGNLIEHGIRYYRTLPSIQSPEGAVYSWEKTFASSDRQKVENDLASFGYTAEWTELNSLKYFYKMTSMKSHPVTNEKVWSNQITTCHSTYFKCMPEKYKSLYKEDETPFNTTHADGSNISQLELDTIRQSLWTHAKAHEWKAGDLLVLDNHAVAHGRMAFPVGDRRKLVVGILR